MSIFDTSRKYLPNIDWKSDMRKVRTSSVKSLSTLISCSIRAMYNRVNHAQKQRLMLKLYVNEIIRVVSQRDITTIYFLKTSQ